jgi:hypothetical protein
MKGAIGGEQVEFTGPVYMGPRGATPFTSGAAFYGSFHGQALEAIKSKYAHKAENSKTAQLASKKAGGQPSGGAPDVPKNMESPTPKKPVPKTDAVSGILSDGHLSIRAIAIDPSDELRNAILLRDDFEGLFEINPTIDEIRSSLRDPANISLIGNVLVQKQLIASDYKSALPPKTGRVAKKDTSPRFGYVALGNSVNNRGKRFK